MVRKLYLQISDSKYIYGEYTLEKTVVSREASQLIKKRKWHKIDLDSSFINYLLKELYLSGYYRNCLIKYWIRNGFNILILITKTTKYNLIDYKWNDCIYYMVRERCELDQVLSWLSTLGGAFSALGDYFPSFADTAGKISFHQLTLALRLQDPNIAARCRLYLSLSLIQKKKFKIAKQIIYHEYQKTKDSVIIDSRLINMCRGIWSKLQYEHSIFRKPKHNVNNKL